MDGKKLQERLVWGGALGKTEALDSCGWLCYRPALLKEKTILRCIVFSNGNQRRTSDTYIHIQTDGRTQRRVNSLSEPCKRTHRTTLSAGTVHGHRQSESFRGAHTFVCPASPCFWCGWCGWWLGSSGRRSSFCSKNVTSGTSGRGWFGTGRRCGRTASGRRSGLRAPAQTRTADWLWHTWKEREGAGRGGPVWNVT